MKVKIRAMQKKLYVMMLLLSIVGVSYAMESSQIEKNPEVRYRVYHTLDKGVVVTKIDVFLLSKDPSTPGRIIKTISYDQYQAKKMIQMIILARREAELNKVRREVLRNAAKL